MATHRQLEMEARLPEASPNLCGFLWDQLMQAGVPADADTIRLIGRLISHYIKNTEDGKTTVFKLLQTQLVPASPTSTYYQSGKEGEESAKIPYTDLVEYKGWIYRKVLPVAHSAVSAVQSADTLGCDDCGILGPKQYCVQTALTRTAGGREALEALCNKCRTFSTNPKIRDTADRRVCEGCPMTSCDHHPKRQLLLLPDLSSRRQA